jgi:hypothetical protein
VEQVPNDKEYNQTDELSRCLDSLHDGERPVIQDGEIEDLLEVAVLVKQSFSQEDLPKLLIDEMADTLSAELRMQKQRQRRHWLYGGLAGTAAAVVIAAFVQFLLPQAPGNHIAQSMDTSLENQQIVAAADSAKAPIAAESPKVVIPQQDQTEESTKATVPSPNEDKSVDSVSKVITDIIQGTEVPAIEQKPNQVAILQQQVPNDMMMQKNAARKETSNKSVRASKSIQPEHKMTMMMVMPNQTAQSTTVDNDSGVIQQIYHLDNNDEIIITQRLLDESGLKSKDDAQQTKMQVLEKSAIQPFTEKTKDNSNSITVKVDKYDITIEGKETTAELQKIAASLTAKKLE